MHCHGCGKEIAVEDRVGRQDTCPGCGRPLHCCLNCRFQDPAAHNQCREPRAEWVSDRQGSNFCEYFTPGGRDPGSRGSDRAAEARRKLDDLFR